jgi:hypothetical protein
MDFWIRDTPHKYQHFKQKRTLEILFACPKNVRDILYKKIFFVKVSFQAIPFFYLLYRPTQINATNFKINTSS